MYYIGISAYYHESSVALINRDKIICFLKEEWLTRIKGDNNFPKHSLNYLIKNYKLDNTNIKKICFYEKPFTSWWSIFSYSIKNPILNREFLINHIKNFYNGSIFFKKHLKDILKIDSNKIIFSSHHLSHALYSASFLKDKNEDLAVISIDGVGEGITSSIFEFDKNKINCLETTEYPNSIGLFYSMITDFLGFNVNEDEYKVMSLSSYGKPTYYNKLLNVFNIKNFKLNKKYINFHKSVNKSFSHHLENLIGSPFLDIDDKKNFTKYSNIAASAQKILEVAIDLMLQKTKKITNKKKIIICGGVGLNCKAITQVAKNHNDINIFVPPSPGDSGSAIGAAFFGLYQHSKKLNFYHKSPFVGPNREDMINKNDLNNFFKIFNTSKKNTLNEIYKLINSGEIIATYLGKSEIGPRALGNTSLICNALNEKTVYELNNVIKKRDKFQPLAPMVLEKNFDKYFIKQKNIYKNQEWMGSLCKFKQIYHKTFKSIAHVDGTLRAQVVKHGDIKNLLNFLDKKKIKILINTSFNISKDPFVFDLIDVYVNMKRMNIKYLYCIDRIYIIK